MAKKYKKKYKRLEERYDILNEHMLDITANVNIKM